MENKRQADIKDIWTAIYRGRLLLGAAVVLSLSVTLLLSLTSPKVYQSTAIVSVPESSKLTAIASESQGTMFVMVNVGGTTPYKSRPTTVSLVNVEETKAMVSQLSRRLANGEVPPPFETTDRRAIVSIKVEPIKGSENYFQLVTMSRDGQSSAALISQKVLKYLAGNPYVSEKFASEISAIEQNIKDTEEALSRAVKYRDDLNRSGQFRQNPNFNPAELEASINGLKMRLSNLKTHSAGISNYRYIEAPSGPSQAIKPNLPANILMSLALGLFLGLLVAFIRYGLTESTKQKK